MKGVYEIWYFDGRDQNRQFYWFESTLQRIYSTSNSFWQLIDTVKSNNRTGVRHGKSNWEKICLLVECYGHGLHILPIIADPKILN